eukprot:s173_g10.t1
MASHVFGTDLSSPSDLFEGVIHVEGCTDDGMSTGYHVPSHTPVLVLHPVLRQGRVTLYDFVFHSCDDLLIISASETSWWCFGPTETASLSPKLLELCAGLGGMGIGASFLGGIPWVSVDCNQLAVEHLRANGHGTVLQLDLTDRQATRIIHETCAEFPGTVTLGFPCQPHSAQGLQLGSKDHRFQVFYGGLRMIFFSQCQSAILECVPAAGQHDEVQAGLRLLAEAMGMQLLTLNMDLSDQWPCRRSRWWALLLPSSWCTIGLPPWPASSSYTTCGTILQSWGVWSETDELDLQLFDFELAAYANPQYGTDKRLLELTDLANTVLHSYGNALLACPCKCRAGPFRNTTLLQGGLRGYFVQSLVHGNPRFLHPREIALLLGIPDSVNYPHPVRSSLALLGLVASPLQMLWIYGHLRHNFQRAKLLPPLPSPAEWLHAYKQELLKQTATLFQATSIPPQQALKLIDSQGEVLHVLSPTMRTVGQLLRAHRIILGWNESGSLNLDGRSLSLAQVLDSFTGPYLLETAPGPHNRPRPSGPIMIGLTHEGHFQALTLPAGGFIFQALRDLDIHDVNFLVDEKGKIYGADFRVWRALRLTTLHPSAWPPLLPSSLQASGLAEPRLGLSDGQIWWGLCQMLASVNHPTFPMLVHPRVAHDLLNGITWTYAESLRDEFVKSDGRIFCIFTSDDHWAFLWGLSYHGGLSWHYCDGLPGRAASASGFLAATLTELLDLDFWTISSNHLYRQIDQHVCGTLALLHAVGHSLGFKGVPSNLASERAAAAIQKLGLSPVQQALAQANAWQALKALTTKPGSHFQFVLKAELNEYITHKASSKHGAQISSKKKATRSQFKADAKSWNLDPRQLALHPKHFVDNEGDSVPQITLDEVTADARGLAICTAAEAQPYMWETKNISADALALLLTEGLPPESRGHANITTLRFPATFLPTNDPVLINGCILQLGDLEVKRHSDEELEQAMDVGQTHVLKVQMFRDELSPDWESVTQSPIRFLIQKAPQFRLCTDVRCDHKCGLFHAAVEDSFDQVLLEIWGRRFQTIEGKQTTADKSEIFQAFLRIAAPALDTLLALVIEGVYLEPRSGDLKATDSDYAVVWLPGATREVAYHKLKLTGHGISLVRMKHRFGIRVATTYEAHTYKELRPSEEFVKVDIQFVYRIHPLPHGLQRAQVAKLLKDWQWHAKPLQPARGTAEGAAWDVGAAKAPPCNTMPAFSKDVLITLLRDKSSSDKPPAVVGPRRVQSHLQKATQSAPSTSSSDPWLQPGHDPWKHWHHTSDVAMASARPSSGPAAQKRFDSLKTQLTSELRQQFQEQLPGDSYTTENEMRFTKLETGMAELQAQGQQFRQWFEDSGNKMASHDQQLSQIQAAVSQQQQDLTAVRSEIHTSADALHQAMQYEKRTQPGFGHHLDRPHGPSGIPHDGQEITAGVTRTADPVSDCQFGSGSTVQSQSDLCCDWISAVLTPCHRWGEALHPGPPQAAPTVVPFGFSNPAGLRNKEEIAIDLGPGVWSFAETHLSAITQRSCQHRLRHLATCAGRNFRVHMGAPVATRANSSWAGTWSGVMTFADGPSQRLQLPYGEAFNCGRILTTSHFFPQTMVTNTVVYGYPSGPTWPRSKELTAALLEAVTQEVVLGGHGPRLVGGDFNTTSDGLDCFAYWQQLGWQSAQVFAHQVWGQQPQPTCKHSTECDHVWLSPEALALCRYVDIADFFLRSLYNHSGVGSGVSCGKSVVVAFAIQNSLARSRPVLKPSRPSEVALRSDLIGSTTKSWFRQLRRLQSYVAAIVAQKMTPAAVAYRVELWSSIRRSPGFDDGFPFWWAHHRLLTLPDAPDQLPLGPPPAVIARHIFDVFKMCFEQFESWHLRQRCKLLKAKYDKGMTGIYHDLKRPVRDQLDFLCEQEDYVVLAIDPALQQVHVDRPVTDDPAAKWTWEDQSVVVRQVEDVLLTLDVPPSMEFGHVLTQH